MIVFEAVGADRTMKEVEKMRAATETRATCQRQGCVSDEKKWRPFLNGLSDGEPTTTTDEVGGGDCSVERCASKLRNRSLSMTPSARRPTPKVVVPSRLRHQSEIVDIMILSGSFTSSQGYCGRGRRSLLFRNTFLVLNFLKNAFQILSSM